MVVFFRIKSLQSLQSKEDQKPQPSFYHMHHNTPRSVRNRIQQNMARAQKRAQEEAQYKRQQKRAQEECNSDVEVHTASSSHCEAGSSTSRVNLADAASHSRLHSSSSASQCSSTTLAVSSSAASNVLANDRSVEGHHSSEKSAEHAAPA